MAGLIYMALAIRWGFRILAVLAIVGLVLCIEHLRFIWV